MTNERIKVDRQERKEEAYLRSEYEQTDQKCQRAREPGDGSSNRKSYGLDQLEGIPRSTGQQLLATSYHHHRHLLLYHYHHSQ